MFVALTVFGCRCFLFFSSFLPSFQRLGAQTFCGSLFCLFVCAVLCCVVLELTGSAVSHTTRLRWESSTYIDVVCCHIYLCDTTPANFIRQTRWQQEHEHDARPTSDERLAAKAAEQREHWQCAPSLVRVGIPLAFMVHE